ncbi:MAG: sulfite reductase flavoprotein subunit alpha, partial [Planctomycetota bacterium]
LGDSSYTHFNKAARDLDTALEKLGGKRVTEMVPCDVAYEDDYDGWKQAVFAAEPFQAAAGSGGAISTDAPAEPTALYTKNTPFGATILDIQNLNGPGSKKEVNHVEISLAGAGVDLDYQVGDALGVWPVNCAEHVEQVLSATGFTGRETVQLKAGPTSLRAALLKHLDICVVTPKTLETLNLDLTMEKVEGIHVVDLIETHRPDATPQQLAEALRPLQPRLYSIASSPTAHPGEVHLTVGAVRYQTNGRHRKGVASTFLADRCGCGATLGVYLQRSAHFHLPNDPDAPVIMVGPGTGIAPFRAFLEERDATNAPGRNWLFFGDQHQATDFLYRDQLTDLQNRGVLDRLSLAWSRDTDAKVYVQDKMRESADELKSWIDDGAFFYVCGDASRMAKDVDAALIDIVGAETVKQLSADGRYQKDVY